MGRANLVGRERHEREEGPERQEPGEAPVTSYTPTGIAYDRAGPRRDTPVVLLHAGVADRRMWDPQWPPLTAERDVVRLDLRGFGDSTRRPEGPLSRVDDVIDTLAHLDIERCHLVGASFGAGVAIEVALTRPELVDSLLLSAPGGSLVAQVTPDLRAFIETEGSALAADDLDGAVKANLAWWVAGPQRDIDGVDARIRNSVGQMQRRAFEVTADWDDVEEKELQPSALDRLGEIRARTLVLVGALDLDAISVTADRVTHGIHGARRIDWPNTAHLPSMERPADFLALLQEWLRLARSGP
jgi:3-oxoadipate enol-lactonase